MGHWTACLHGQCFFSFICMRTVYNKLFLFVSLPYANCFIKNYYYAMWSCVPDMGGGLKWKWIESKIELIWVWNVTKGSVTMSGISRRSILFSQRRIKYRIGDQSSKKNYKESVVTSWEIFYRILTRFDDKFVQSAPNQPPTISDTVGGAVICTRASYDSTVWLVGGARRNRKISRRAPPMQSVGAAD